MTGSVIDVNKMWSKDSFDVESLTGLRKKAQIVVGYQIVTTPDCDEVTIAASSQVPATGSPFATTDDPPILLPQIRLKRRSFGRVSPILWIGTMNYEGEFGPNGPSDSPLNIPPVISWSDTSSTEAIDQDFDGNPIVTANNEPIEGVTMEIADNVLTVERNYALFSPWLTTQYRHSVTGDQFAGYPAGTGRMIRFSARQAWDEDDNGYWAVSASIQFRFPYNTTPEKAWYARVRHEGYYEKVDSRIIHAVDANKEKVSKPVLLKEDGTRETDPANAHWLEFKKYNSLSYNALGLLN